MTRSDVQSIIDDMLYAELDVSEVIIYTRFNALRLVKDEVSKWPAFTLSDTMLTLENPGGYKYLSLDGIDLITANV